MGQGGRRGLPIGGCGQRARQLARGAGLVRGGLLERGELRGIELGGRQAELADGKEEPAEGEAALRRVSLGAVEGERLRRGGGAAEGRGRCGGGVGKMQWR